MPALTPHLSDLIETYGEPGQAYLSPQHIADALGVQIESLAKRARVSPQIARRRPQDDHLQRYLHEVIKVLAAAEEAAQGDRGRAIFWFMNEPLGDFDWLTPDKLVASSKAQAVINYIESITGGASG